MIYARTLAGDLYEVQASSFEDMNGIYKSLAAQGFKNDTQVILSAEPFPPEKRIANLPSLLEAQLPPIPQPASPSSILPATSALSLVSQASPYDLLYLYLVSLLGLQFWVSASWGNYGPPLPAGLTFNYFVYWLNLQSFVIEGPQSFSHEVSNTLGMSQTDSETYSSELGVTIGNLGSKLSAAFESSITVESSQTVTNTYELTIPENQTAVYTIWQLIASFQVLDSSGQPFNYYSGYVPYPDSPVGFVNFPAYKAETFLTTINSDPVLFPS